jgi:hypothetical protein
MPVIRNRTKPSSISRKNFLKALGAGALVPMLGRGQPGNSAPGIDEAPNVILIISDDHAPGELGILNPVLKTPNLDRIAHEGAIFNNSFVGNSICCPCRATVLTGKHSHLNGVLGHEPSSRWNGTQWVYPRELANAGYQTALIGKWHMIPNPTNNEFQYWDVLSGYGGQGSYYNPDFIGSSGPSKVIGYSSDIITDKALDWLKNRWLASVVLGAAAGPLSYWAGARLGALELIDPVPALLALAIGWALMTPLLLAIARRFDGVHTTNR